MKKKYILPIVLGLLALGTLFALRTWPRTLDAEQCGELYRQYAATPGIHASFIKDYPVNDTLAVDVIHLQASSDSTWCDLLVDFGMPKAFLNKYYFDTNSFTGDDVNNLIMFYIDKDNPQKRLPRSNPNSRLAISFHKKKSLYVFMTEEKDIKEIISLTHVQDLKQ